MRKVVAILAVFPCLISCDGSEKHPETVTSLIEIKEMNNGEVYAATKKMLDQLNPKFPQIGLPQLEAKPDDTCYLGFIKTDADGKYAGYVLDSDILNRDKKISYRQAFSGQCTYDASKNIDTCKAANGQESYQEYADKSFLKSTFYNSIEDFKNKTNPTEIEVSDCSSLGKNVFDRIDKNEKPLDGGIFKTEFKASAPLMRAIVENPAFNKLEGQTTILP